MSAAQDAVLHWFQQNLFTDGTTITNGATDGQSKTTNGVSSTPAKSFPSNAANSKLGHGGEATPQPHSSMAGSPPPESTPQPFRSGSPGPAVPTTNDAASAAASLLAAKHTEAEQRDKLIPIAPLDFAILTSITHGSRGDERKLRDFLGGIMLCGGGAKIRGFSAFLEEKLKELRPGLAKDVLVGAPPRELESDACAWKGASVFARLPSVRESFISRLEWEMLGSRVLGYKCLWQW